MIRDRSFEGPDGVREHGYVMLLICKGQIRSDNRSDKNTRA